MQNNFFSLPRQIILASSSPQRARLLKSINLEFSIIPAQLDEKAITIDQYQGNHAKRVEAVARAKAELVHQQNPQAIVMAADTYCVFNGSALEKPTTLAEASQMLQQLSGQQFQGLTGFCYLDTQGKIDFSTALVTAVTFRSISPAEIQHYVKTRPVLTWSAAFSPAYDQGANFIASINGPFTSFTHGLPVELVVKYLEMSARNKLAAE